MSSRTLNVVTCAYRATLEEQDDPILWLTRSMRNANASVDVLLWGNAVAYAARAQDAAGLTFGERQQTQPPRLADDTAALHATGEAVFYVAADARERGIAPAELIDGAIAIETTAVPELFARYDRVLWW